MVAQFLQVLKQRKRGQCPWLKPVEALSVDEAMHGGGTRGEWRHDLGLLVARIATKPWVTMWCWRFCFSLEEQRRTVAGSHGAWWLSDELAEEFGSQRRRYMRLFDHPVVALSLTERELGWDVFPATLRMHTTNGSNERGGRMQRSRWWHFADVKETV